MSRVQVFAFRLRHEAGHVVLAGFQISDPENSVRDHVGRQVGRYLHELSCHHLKSGLVGAKA